MKDCETRESRSEAMMSGLRRWKGTHGTASHLSNGIHGSLWTEPQRGFW